MAVELTAAAREQTRARYPDSEGYVERDGVRVFYEVYGEGEPTILFLPTVVARPLALLEAAASVLRTTLPRDRIRPARERAVRPAADERGVHETEFAADALAVLDATGTERRSWSRSRSAPSERCVLAAEHPERVQGIVFIAPSVPLAPATRTATASGSTSRSTRTRAGRSSTRHYWLARLPGLPRVLHLAVRDGAALDEADRGRRRLGAGDRRRDAPHPLARTRRSARLRSASSAPGAPARCS